MKNIYLFLLILSLFSCDLFNDDDSSEEVDYSYYYPSEVVDYQQAPGFYSNYSSFNIKDNTDNILDFPEGSVPSVSSIITLGEAGGYVTVRFDQPIENLTTYNGYDFIIYSNVFSYSSSTNIEPGFVEVSEDNETWYLLVSDDSLDCITTESITYNEEDYIDNDAWPDDYTDDSMTLTTWSSTNYADEKGYCEMTPRVENNGDDDQVTFYANPDIRGGGDAFDISWAVDSDLNRLDTELEEISYIRITTGVYSVDSLASTYSATSTEIDSIIRIDSDL